MPKTIKLNKLGAVIIPPAPRWSSDSRLTEGDKQALASYTREVEKAVSSLVSALREVQNQLDGAVVT
jgi:hypothetical protein